MFLSTRWRMAAISAAAPIGLCGISLTAPAQIIAPPIPPLAPGNWYGPTPWSLPNSPFGLWAGTLSLDYARLIPSVGTDGNQVGANGAGLWMFSDNLGLNTDFGYHNVTRALTPHLGSTTAAGALVWRGPDFRLGPAIGYQGNAQTAGLSTKTFNYGGYGDYFFSPMITLSGKGGYFTSHPGSGGYYLGGQGKFYPDPDLALHAGLDYTKFTHVASFSETDYSAGIEYRLPWSMPMSAFGRYSYSDFSPGKFNINTVTVGLKFYFNANGATTLVDRQRTGTLDTTSSLVSAVQLRF